MNVYLLVEDQNEMESLPKTMIDILNNQLRNNGNLSWRVHGMQDKVVMNIMWSNTQMGTENLDFPQKNFTLSSLSQGLSSQQIVAELISKETQTSPYKPDTPVDSGHSESRDTPTPRPDSKRGRLLPPIPDPEAELDMPTGENSRNTVMTGGQGQFRLEYILMTEYNNLHKHKLPGVYVLPSALSPLIWNGIIFIRQGLYQEAVFRFNLNIPENYPNCDCPRVFFEHPVFHPCVDPKTGELDVKRDFKKWRRNVNFLWQVLMYVRRIFFKIDNKCPLNQEAADLYEQNIEQYKLKVLENIRSSKEVLYNPDECNDAHMIRFSPWDPSIHEEAKSDMLTRKKNRSDLETEPHKKNGLSWMKAGTTEIFSQEESSSV